MELHVNSQSLPSPRRHVGLLGAVAASALGRRAAPLKDNDALYYWAEGLSIARPDLRLDPAVLR
jgi:hypothetical protein